MVDKGSIKSLSAVEIKNKFSLEVTPSYGTDVTVLAGQIMRASTANGILGNGGGGVQFEVTNKPKTEAEQKAFNSWFTNPRQLK